MNGVPEEYEVKLTQTSKGVFYVDRIGVKADNIDNAINEISVFGEKIKGVLTDLNKEETN